MNVFSNILLNLYPFSLIIQFWEFLYFLTFILNYRHWKCLYNTAESSIDTESQNRVKKILGVWKRRCFFLRITIIRNSKTNKKSSVQLFIPYVNIHISCYQQHPTLLRHLKIFPLKPVTNNTNSECDPIAKGKTPN